MTLLHGIAGGCAVGLLAGVIVAAWPWIAGTVSRFRAWRPALGPSVDGIAMVAAVVSQHGTLVMFGVAACLVLAPLALYFALGDE